MSKLLSELPFVDLYVCLQDIRQSHYKPRRNEFSRKANYRLTVDYKEDLQQLVTHLREELAEHDEPSITYGDMRLRASLIVTANGEEWVVLRRNPGRPPLISQLNLDPRFGEQLRQLGKRDGLILIVGATGHGKTTTACSILQDYLEHYGNIAYTIEDPVEFDLEGRHGINGHCYQTEARTDADWALKLKKSLRWQPQYVFVGEVRTPDAAAQLLRAATSGHLVITTIHGGSIEEGLEGLLQLAEQSAGVRAPLLLAAGLTAVWHQQLNAEQLRTRFYIAEENNMGDPVRNLIRSGQIGQMATFVDKQMAKLAGMPLPPASAGFGSGMESPGWSHTTSLSATAATTAPVRKRPIVT